VNTQKGATVVNEYGCGSKLVGNVPAGSYKLVVSKNGGISTYKVTIYVATGAGRVQRHPADDDLEWGADDVLLNENNQLVAAGQYRLVVTRYGATGTHTVGLSLGP